MRRKTFAVIEIPFIVSNRHASANNKLATRASHHDAASTNIRIVKDSNDLQVHAAAAALGECIGEGSSCGEWSGDWVGE